MAKRSKVDRMIEEGLQYGKEGHPINDEQEEELGYPTVDDDPVAHPSHYNRGNIEVLDFILDQEFSYCAGNVVKYVSRAGFKNPSKHVEDLEKAKFYLEQEIKRVKNA